MKVKTESGMVLESSDEGLTLSGGGTVHIDTGANPKDGMIRLSKEMKLSLCPNCKHWLEVQDGKLIHNDIESVRCVLSS
jgi:hypothetical protein